MQHVSKSCWKSFFNVGRDIELKFQKVFKVLIWRILVVRFPVYFHMGIILLYIILILISVLIIIFQQVNILHLP
ncbi:hypothetical protein CKY04_01580 [Photorhabdus sp. S8-52]|nr:hypothetical protein CKY03_01580 [Photorhabdus sp. S9-53]RAX03938.1 hypothetical protein CKY05_01580 [Photorhabdus sp. S10-54]RAX05975.1 hypothetical protein CKY04_01580 [Photorhabdus sp. S8-52]